MDWIYGSVQILALFLSILWFFTWLCERKNGTGWQHELKRQLAWRWISRTKKNRRQEELSDSSAKMDELIDGTNDISKDTYDSNVITYYGHDQKNNFLFLRINKRSEKYVELQFFLSLKDGRYYELPNHPSTVTADFGGTGWTGAGFKITVLEPKFRLRVLFNGILRKDRGDTLDDLEHVRLNCIFIANCRPISRDEFWSSELQAETLAFNTWNRCKWQKLINSLENEEAHQYGSFMGQVTFEDSSITDLYLRGLRQYHLGKFDAVHFETYISLTGMDNLGFSFYLSFADVRNGLKNIQLGHVKEPVENVYTINSLNFPKDIVHGLNKHIDRLYKFEFAAGNRKYTAIVKLDAQKNGRSYFGGCPCDSMYTYCNVELELNGSPGFGLLEIRTQPSDRSSNSDIKPLPSKSLSRSAESADDSRAYALSFDDERCQSEKLVGGKGASLAELSAMKTTQFTVPRGFCVTVHALDAHIKYHTSLEAAIDEFVKVCSGEKVGSVKKYSDKVVALIESTPVLHTVRKAILEAFEALNSADGKGSYAVRSSAVGEDSEDTSAAGQNSTYLGVKDAEEVVKYVAHCWASLFTHQSIEYRRQHGLAVKASMGVCVQQMVEAEAAGVMFTRHPLTGNPKEIFITSNYGLGEAVVSALVDPDTILIQRNPLTNSLSVKSATIGKKSQKISVDSEGGGTRRQSLTETESTKLSLTAEAALRLAEIGVDLDGIYGAPRDVEWAVGSGGVFLLQCRPVTALDAWTEFELTHELGSGAPNDTDIISFANVGEVLPMAATPLTLSTVIRGLNLATESSLLRKETIAPLTYASHIFVVNMRCTLNYINLLLRFVQEKITLSSRVMEIAVAGRSIITPEIHETAKRRNGVQNLAGQLRFGGDMVADLWRNLEAVQQAESLAERCRRLRIVRDLDEIEEPRVIYEGLDELFEMFTKTARNHNFTSRSSIFYQIVLMSILTEGSKEFTMEHYSDIAVLLGSCSDVISAQVPVVLKQITKTIKDSGLSEQFKNVEHSDAMDWLLSNCPKAYEQVQEFIKVHGYRAFEEFDLITETWGMKPEKFLSTIQSMMTTSGGSTEAAPSKDLTPGETVALLKTPKKRSTRWLLRALLPASRKAVVRREMTKSLVIELVHHLRLAYRRLATLLARQGKIPDEMLVFFFTHQELGRLMEGPDPALVRKAVRRRKLRPKLQRHKYREVNFGIPLPIETTKLATLAKGVLIQGTSVCNGVVTGRACVALTLEEASEIKAGDILITHATDIGWSPYFPLLSGVVTELGGLISHGAVVAREYGLPCIVSADSATRLIKTGETVTLNGYAGTLQVIDES